MDSPRAASEEPAAVDPEVAETKVAFADNGSEKTFAENSASLSGSSDSQPKRDIFLNLEILDSTQHKVAQGVWFLLICTATALVVTVIYLRVNTKKGKNVKHYLTTQVLFKLQTAFAVICTSLLLPMLAWFCHRIRATWQCEWTRRQRYLVSIAFLQLLFQSINSIFWLIPNAYILARKCSYFDGIVNASAFIRWTCWNTVFCLVLIHAHNCRPALKKNGKHKDPSPDRDNPKYGNNPRDPMILDGNFWRMHWLKLIYWAVFEASILYLAGAGVHFRHRGLQPLPDFCKKREVHAFPDARYIVLLACWGCLLISYQVVIQWRLRLSLWKLKMQPYNCYQLANLLLLWQKRQTLWMELIGIAEISNIYFNYQDLFSYMQQWTGQPTLQVLISGGTLLTAFYFLPMEPSNEEHVYRAWLQQFAWTEAQVPRQRQRLLMRSPTLGPRLLDKPMFCFETGLKLLLWSDVIYERDQDKGGPGLSTSVREGLEAQQKPAGPKVLAEKESETTQEDHSDQLGAPSSELGGLGRSSSSSSSSSAGESTKLAKGNLDSQGADVLEEAAGGDTAQKKGAASHIAIKVDCVLSSQEALELGMQMYGLENVKIINGAQTDTKVIIAWSGTTMVLAFRGTQSMVNFRSDAKAWRVAHPPERGTFWLGSRPLIHKGFLHAWLEVEAEVLQTAEEVLQAASIPVSSFRVLLTGHSLGGALATLAAFGIQKIHRLSKLSCYTYGAPRTGNTAFAKEFALLCPDCWHIINDKDAVPRTGKFLWMYKRPGDRVLLSALGDIRVRPNIFEINLLTHGFSVKQHALTAYLKALGAVCLAQLFKYKGIEGGLRGVKHLSKSPEVCKLLTSIGIDLKAAVKHPPLELSSMTKKSCWGWTWNLVDAFKDMPPFLPIGD